MFAACQRLAVLARPAMSGVQSDETAFWTAAVSLILLKPHLRTYPPMSMFIQPHIHALQEGFHREFVLKKRLDIGHELSVEIAGSVVTSTGPPPECFQQASKKARRMLNTALSTW